MRIRKVKNAEDIVNSSDYVIPYKEAIKHKGMFKEEIFHNLNPVHLEIGMGKGDFIIDMAKKNPSINFIGVERYESVVCRALEKLENEHLDNVKILCFDADCLHTVFCKEVDVIYLNFSDPWPKKRHAKRRLTAPKYLDLYDQIFVPNGTIIQKTDSTLLFESSIINLSKHGYVIEDISLDLHSTEKENSLTEYERKFSSQGIKINYLKAQKK